MCRADSIASRTSASADVDYWREVFANVPDDKLSAYLPVQTHHRYEFAGVSLCGEGGEVHSDAAAA